MNSVNRLIMTLKYKDNEKGISFIQFGLILPIVVLMLGLIADMGEIIIIKSNLQHLVGEVHKSLVLYEEFGVEGGVKTHLSAPTSEEQVKKIIEANRQINNDNLNVEIKWSEKRSRNYMGHYNNGYSYETNMNRIDLKDLEVIGTYKVSYKMFVTKQILGDGITIEERFVGPVYVGGDGWDE